MDANGVDRAALIASVPGDEASVAAAVARHPGRIVGFFMVDPARADAPASHETRAHRTGADGSLSFPCDAPRAAGGGAHPAGGPGCVRMPGRCRICALRTPVGGRPGQARAAKPLRFRARRSHRPVARWRRPSRTCRSSFRTSGRDGSPTRSRRSAPAPMCISTRRARTAGFVTSPVSVSLTSSHPRLRRRAQRGCSSAPIRRSFRVAGSAGFTSIRKPLSMNCASVMKTRR